jgi:hypothetical protein
MKEEIKKLEIILRAEDLQDYVFRVTSKEPKQPKDGSKPDPEKNYGLPAKYRYSIGTRMQNHSLDLLDALEDARYDKSHRVEHLNRVLSILRKIESLIWLCFRNNILAKNTAEHGVSLLLNVKHMALAWRTKS